MHFLLFPLLSLSATVYSSHLTVIQSIEDQLPVIARVNEPFSWSFSPQTFGPSTETLKYSTLSLPDWLSFDAETRTFSGTPSEKDEGNPKIAVKAENSSGSASSVFTLCITSYPQPILQNPIKEQFNSSNPSLSSVFTLAPDSVLKTTNPALRIPPKWSFSIGFRDDTFSSTNNLFYEARMNDSSFLPDWMVFNSNALTLNGVVPNGDVIPETTVLPLSLLASDQEGYTASSQNFDLIIASHELSASTSSLPTINLTASTLFNVSLTSLDDYWGFFVDGRALQSSEIKSLDIDTSEYNWLIYDKERRTLSGTPDTDTFETGKFPRLPTVLTTTFNQSIHTELTFAIVASYFSSPTLSPLHSAQGDTIQFDLASFYSNAASHGDTNLTAAFEPVESGDWLKFIPETGQLEGIVPLDFSQPRILVTFTAYSRITHSTSHASLAVSILAPERRKNIGTRPGGLSAVAHAKLVLGLGITFGVVGGLCFLGVVLAAFRHCARVEDTAIGGEEGRNVWSEQDKKWYGLPIERTRLTKEVRGYRWTERSPRFSEKFRLGPDHLVDANTSRDVHDYRDLGLGLRRVSERSQSELNTPGDKSHSPGVMSKREFIMRIKETVRNVSDKAQGRKVSRKRPIIGKPIMKDSRGDPSEVDEEQPIKPSPSNPFNEPHLSNPGSTIMTNSPSTSTAEHSIPRRRADFAPPRSPAPIHFGETSLSRQLSSGSTGSLASNASATAHAAEAVVQTATKAMSVRSGRYGQGYSTESFIPEPAQVATGTRPRLVPFTSATRVPVPRPPSPPSLPSQSEEYSPSKRVTSQTAKVWKVNFTDEPGIVRSGSGDELQMGLHYVRSLGIDLRVNSPNSSSPALATTSRLSQSVLSPGNRDNDDSKKDMVRTVAIGEKFMSRVPIPPAAAPSSRTRKVEARLVSGKPLPLFLHVDMSGVKSKGAVEFYGTPGARDLGEFLLGVYANDGECLARLVIRVVGQA